MKSITQQFNQFLARFGFRIARARIRKLPLVRPGVVQVRVGSAMLVMPEKSSIPFEYAANPGYGSQIGRLARYLKSKINDYLAIDVGANVGDTLSLIRQAADVPVLCIEGDAECASLFRENSAAFDRVELVESFLSEAEGDEQVSIDKEGWNTTLNPDIGGHSRLLRFRTLDSITASRKLPCALLKLDVEGYEWKILRGGEKLLAQDQPVICLEYNLRHSGFPSEDFVKGMTALRALGYNHGLIYDAQGIFLQTISLAEAWNGYLDLHHFLLHERSPILYVDITLFPASRQDLFEPFLAMERDCVAKSQSPCLG
jgi:FkbM family methyltransferase